MLKKDPNRRLYVLDIPLTTKWIYKKCEKYVRSLKFKGKSYNQIREELRNICSFMFFKLNIKNIVVLKNYYNKNNIIVCIKPLIGNNKIVFIKEKHSKFYSDIVDRNYNVFTENKRRRRNVIKTTIDRKRNF